jgi:hypothetical protein
MVKYIFGMLEPYDVLDSREEDHLRARDFGVSDGFVVLPR